MQQKFSKKNEFEYEIIWVEPAQRAICLASCESQLLSWNLIH